MYNKYEKCFYVAESLISIARYVCTSNKTNIHMKFNTLQKVKLRGTKFLL